MWPISGEYSGSSLFSVQGPDPDLGWGRAGGAQHFWKCWGTSLGLRQGAGEQSGPPGLAKKKRAKGCLSAGEGQRAKYCQTQGTRNLDRVGLGLTCSGAPGRTRASGVRFRGQGCQGSSYLGRWDPSISSPMVGEVEAGVGLGPKLLSRGQSALWGPAEP